jgi:hypothetical protein
MNICKRAATFISCFLIRKIIVPALLIQKNDLLSRI